MYVATGLGITVGFHRHLTHRAFKAKRPVRAVLAVLGSAAIEGPVISWVADHRKHHAFADKPGDPHSPHVDHGHGVKGALRGLLHAHVGWLFIHTQRGRRDRYAPDLLADPVIRYVDRTFFVWAVGGLVAAFGLGWLIGGSVATGLTGLLWGGAVRMLVLHHVTYSINSLCHFFGRRDFETRDESRNLAVAVAVLVRRVLAQQPPRLPDVGERTACAAGSSTSRPPSSGRSRSSAWPGTSCAWPRSASARARRRSSSGERDRTLPRGRAGRAPGAPLPGGAVGRVRAQRQRPRADLPAALAGRARAPAARSRAARRGACLRERGARGRLRRRGARPAGRVEPAADRCSHRAPGSPPRPCGRAP